MAQGLALPSFPNCVQFVMQFSSIHLLVGIVLVWPVIRF